MTAKVSVLILAFGVCAIALLAMRQARLQAAHDMARSLDRLQLIEQKRWAVRVRIAEAVTPDRIAEIEAVLETNVTPAADDEAQQQAPRTDHDSIPGTLGIESDANARGWREALP